MILYGTPQCLCPSTLHLGKSITNVSAVGYTLCWDSKNVGLRCLPQKQPNPPVIPLFVPREV